jgi:hypothetical protein
MSPTAKQRGNQPAYPQPDDCHVEARYRGLTVRERFMLEVLPIIVEACVNGRIPWKEWNTEVGKRAGFLVDQALEELVAGAGQAVASDDSDPMIDLALPVDESGIRKAFDATKEREP